MAINLDHLYEMADREHNFLRSNWDWFVAQGKENPHGGCPAAVLARVDQN